MALDIEKIVTEEVNEALEAVSKEDIFDYYLNIMNKDVNMALTETKNNHLRSAIRNTYQFTRQQANYKMLSQNDVRIAFAKRIDYADIVKNTNPTSEKDFGDGKYPKKEIQYNQASEKVKHNIYSVITFDIIEINGQIFTKSITSYVDFNTSALNGENPVNAFDFDFNKNISTRTKYEDTTISGVLQFFIGTYNNVLKENRLMTEKKALKSKFIGLDGGWKSVKQGIGEELNRFTINNGKNKENDINPSGCIDPKKLMQYYKK
jgi:hypothetical protein